MSFEYTHLCVRYADSKRSFPEIWMQHRDEDGNLHLSKQMQSPPHVLYVAEDAPLKKDDPRVKTVTEGFTGYRGEKLKRIELNWPLTKKQIREYVQSFERTWEADYEYLIRFMVEEEIKMSETRRVCNIDIETYMCLDSEKSPQPVLTMTVHDSFTDKMWVFGWSENFTIPLESKKSPQGRDVDILIRDNEVEMWQDFILWWDEYRPDIVTGWNVEYFDMAYIVNRLQRLEGNGMQPLSNALSPYDDRPWAARKRGKAVVQPSIHGLDILDLKRAYERLVGGRRSMTEKGIRALTSYSLQNVAVHELGWGKLPPAKRIDEAWDSEDIADLWQLIDYNITDVEACVEIDLKAGLTEYYVAQQCKFPYPFNAWDQNSRIIDAQLLRTFNGKVVLPSKPPYRKQTFEAAKVFYPPAGVFKNVGCLDIAAMYINVILSCNISPDTIVGPEFAGPKCCVNDVFFRLDKKGIIPTAVENVLAQRKRARAAAVEALNRGDHAAHKALWVEQGAWKTLQLSFYGVTSLPSFRLNDPRVARGITWTGEFLIKYTWWLVEQDEHATPLYGDTDSVYIKLPDEWDRDKCFEYMFDLQDRINKQYDHFMKEPHDFSFTPWTEEEEITFDFQINVEEHSMELKFEKWYTAMLVEGAKKRYAGNKVWEEGAEKNNVIDVTGYEAVKKDTHEVFRHAQAEMFRLLLDGASQDEVQKWVDEKRNLVFTLPVEELAFSKQLTRPLHKYKVRAQHVKAVEYGIKAFQKEYSVGEDITMLKVKGTPEGYPEHEGIIPFDPDRGLHEDWIPFVDRETIWKDGVGKKIKTTLTRIGMTEVKI